VGSESSIVTDSLGAPTIAYRDITDDAVWLARLTADGWRFEQPRYPAGGRSVSLAGRQLVHISIGPEIRDGGIVVGSSVARLKHVDLGPAPDVVTVLHEDAQFAGLAVDVDGRAHVAYLTYSGELLYATDASGAWIHTRVADKGGPPSIGVDASGRAHIAYCPNDDNQLRYATNRSGSWEVTIVDVTALCSQAALAVGPGSDVHVSFSPGLNYATNASGGWLVERMDRWGSTSSITVDRFGRPHISYQRAIPAGDGRPARRDLRYATQVLVLIEQPR
jgi:hypothetical protein